MSLPFSITSTAKVLWHLTMGKVKGNTHQERLESFYSGQAEEYDSFRKRLLHGKESLFDALPVNEGDIWIDLGAGTDENAEHFQDRLSLFQKVYQVDLCEPLLKIGKKRIDHHQWKNVEAVHGDATAYTPPESHVDLVTFSYSLTMIPDWFAALDHAYNLLKPGGHIGIVDFYVSRKYPAEKHTQHRWSTRTFWEVWFANDNVFLNPDHIPYLNQKFECQHFEEHRGKVPFLPFVRAPYYIFIGQKPN